MIQLGPSKQVGLFAAAIAAVAVFFVAVFCVQPGPALALKGGGFDGTVNLEPSSHIGFDVVKEKKLIGHQRWRRTTKIQNFEFGQALAGCGAGLIAPIDAVVPGSVKLKRKKGRFTLKASGPGLSVSVSGSFLKRFRAAYGEFHLFGPVLVDGVTRTCDTGPRGWSAKRTSNSNTK